MLSREVKVLPEFSKRTLKRALVGVRPFRKSGIRLESELFGSKKIIHNYGHGGAGISLAPACAKEAAALVENKADQQVAILGSGIIGLFTALECAKKGWQVDIYANRIPIPNQTNPTKMCTSEVAPGYWLPYHYQFKDIPQHDRRSDISFDEYVRIEKQSDNVNWVDTYQTMSLETLKEQSPPQLFKTAENVIVEIDGQSYQMVKFRTLQINLQPFLQELIAQCQQKGVQFHHRQLKTLDAVSQLPQNTVINCLGLGSKYLFGDEAVYGVKGTLLQFKNTTGMTGIYGFVFEGKPLKFYMFKQKVLVGLTTEKGEDLVADFKIVNQQLDRAIRFYGGPRPKL